MFYLLTNINPITHFKGMLPALITAFSTSSSNATLPVTIRCVQENAKVSKSVSSFVLPLGATIGAIIRKNKAKIAHDNVKLREDDHVILFLTDKNLLNQVQQIFSPS